MALLARRIASFDARALTTAKAMLNHRSVASLSNAYRSSLDKKATVDVVTILINKTSGEFLEIGISTEGPFVDYRGICQLGK